MTDQIIANIPNILLKGAFIGGCCGVIGGYVTGIFTISDKLSQIPLQHGSNIHELQNMINVTTLVMSDMTTFMFVGALSGAIFGVMFPISIPLHQYKMWRSTLPQPTLNVQ
jgi:Mg/Co/Ni transporter MgtE